MGSETSDPAPVALGRPIPLSDYEVPRQVTAEGVVRAWARLWRHGRESEREEPKDPEPVPADELSHLVPAVDLDAAAAKLGRELESWQERAPSALRSVAVVGPPGSKVQDVVEVWARSADVFQVAAPSSAALDQGLHVPVLPDDPDLPLVLPPLERLFLRRSGGLDLLRTLLERLMRERRSFVASGSSWSWSYLRETLHERTGFDRVLAPAAYGGDEIRSWLKGMETRSIVFIDPQGKTDVLKAEDPVHEHLRSLASRARGIPGVIASFWAQALCSAKLEAAVNGVRRCVLPKWEACSLPEMPHHLGKPGALLLHALLLHGALDERALASVLPLGFSGVRPLLWGLAGEGILAEAQDLWSVTALGYPAARSHLATFNVPLDDF
jgi:hypothetical protein